MCYKFNEDETALIPHTNFVTLKYTMMTFTVCNLLFGYEMEKKGKGCELEIYCLESMFIQELVGKHEG